MADSEAGRRWVVFDADNTLWQIEHFYDEARAEMCRFLATLGVDSAKAEQFQRERDVQLNATYGYSACRFARSFEDTLLHFFPTTDPRDICHVRSLALNVFERRAEPVEGLELVFERIKELGYHMAIITAGERWVQERRLNDFHLRDFIAETLIVESKDAHTFRDFATFHGVQTAASWVIGDSRNSDIKPGNAAGFRTILVHANNWGPTEGASADPLPPGTIELDQLRDLVDLAEFRKA